MTNRRHGLLVGCLAVVVSLATLSAQERGPQSVTAVELQNAIDNLGNLEFLARNEAARLIRRAPASQAVPALMTAAQSHPDGYVRYRALVLLTGFAESETDDTIRSLLTDPNSRVREVAYAWFEHHPNPNIVPQLLQLLEREQDEFLRPALVRTLAAHASDPRVRDTLIADIGRGQDLFRSAVIEALGDYRAGAAVSAISEVASLDGPLQDDAALALGRIGDRRSLETLAALQRSAARENQPAIAAAICLLGVNCASHEQYLAESLYFAVENSGYQALMRSASTATAALASSGRESALRLLLDVGVASQNPARAPLALATATVALRNSPMFVTVLGQYPDRERAVGLLAEGFDMLEEDFEEERFYSSVRGNYWNAPDGSDDRRLSQLLIERLGF